MPVTYCDEAYAEVMTWTEDTLIQYAPNRKSGKSFHRYGRYMVAKTVGEALRLGSFGLDLLFDFEKKLLWSVGGPKRERPPDLSKCSKEELKAMCQTDVMLGKMHAKYLMWKKNFAVMEEHGITRHQLKELNDAQDPEGSKDTIIVAVGRRKVQDMAKQILEAVEAEGGRPVTDAEVLSCLQLWGFRENTNRNNVMPEGQEFVYSDTVGLIKMSVCEKTLLTLGSRRYPEFTQLISRWLREQLPPELGREFTYTSININKNYAARLHRDGNNCGPSFIKAFGDFEGGKLRYWPNDDKSTPLERLREEDSVEVDLRENLLLFDGNRAHSVSSFQGERYTLVFFSVRTWDKVPQEEVEEAVRCGIPCPTKASMAFAQSLLKPGRGSFRVWPRGVNSEGGKADCATVANTPLHERNAEASLESPVKQHAAPQVETPARERSVEVSEVSPPKKRSANVAAPEGRTTGLLDALVKRQRQGATLPPCVVDVE